MGILKKSFYNQQTTDVAKQLLGKFLCREIGSKFFKGKIVEVEAYMGKKDLACHASRGKTERNKAMFGPAGHAYVYFIYGMYHCLNVVTEEKDNPCAVLIRALEPMVAGTKQCLIPMKTLNGPGKLCREFKIGKSLNGWNLTTGEKLWLEDGETIKASQIKKAKRVGVNYAGIWKDRLLRFYIKDNEFISKK